MCTGKSGLSPVFFSADSPTHKIREAIAIAAALDSHARGLSNLSRHGRRLSRQFEKTWPSCKSRRTVAKPAQRHRIEGQVKVMASFFQVMNPSRACRPARRRMTRRDRWM